MITETPYLLAFTAGFLGGLGHCIGMCGPIVASYALHSGDRVRSGSASALLPHVLYNAGRITTYSCIGAMMGLTGSFLNVAGKLAGFQDAVSIAAGLIMMTMGFSIFSRLSIAAFLERHNNFILKGVRIVIEAESPLRYYSLGLLLGFLPCGLSYSAFIAAAAAGGLMQGMFLSFCFGVGTAPSLVLFGSVITYLSAGMRDRIFRTSGIAIAAMGLYFLYRGIAANA